MPTSLLLESSDEALLEAGGELLVEQFDAPVGAPARLLVARDAVSARFRAAVSGGSDVFTRATLVQVLESGSVIAEIEGVSDGTVTLNSGAGIRGRLDLSLVDDGTLGLIPTSPDSLLAPFGNELRVWSGVAFPDAQEMVSLGVFVIDEADPDDTGDSLTIPISAFDRAQRISEAKFEDVYTVKPGQLATGVIEDVVREVLPDVEIDFAETSITLPGITAQTGDDRWDFVQGIATAIGAELFFDSDGVLVLQPVPSASGDPSYFFEEGERGVLVDAAKRWARSDIFDRVIVEVNGPSGAVIRGIATDDDPNSATNYYGKFGPKPYFYPDSQFITTLAQANDAAEGILQTMLGAEQAIDFGAIVDPTVRPSDVLRVTRQRLGMNKETHVLDSIAIPLGGATMTGSTRVSQVFS